MIQRFNKDQFKKRKWRVGVRKIKRKIENHAWWVWVDSNVKQKIKREIKELDPRILWLIVVVLSLLVFLIIIVVLEECLLKNWLENRFLERILNADIELVRVWPWFVGFTFSIGVGYVVVGSFVKRWRYFIRDRKNILKDDQPSTFRGIPGWMVGLTEQLVFVPMVALSSNVYGVLPVMGIWIGIKMATGWARTAKLDEMNKAWREWKTEAFVSLFGNILSMAFALGGGMICKISLTKEVVDLKNYVLPTFYASIF